MVVVLNCSICHLCIGRRLAGCICVHRSILLVVLVRLTMRVVPLTLVVVMLVGSVFLTVVAVLLVVISPDQGRHPCGRRPRGRRRLGGGGEDHTYPIITPPGPARLARPSLSG